MPTAARLVAALCLALLAFVVSGQVRAQFPEGTYFGWFTQVNMALGLVIGWTVMGKRAGRGITAAINNGITGVAVLLFWGLFVHAAAEMVELAMRNRYRGPFEALTDILRIMGEYGQVLLTPMIVATLLIGMLLSGLLVEKASKLWR